MGEIDKERKAKEAALTLRRFCKRCTDCRLCPLWCEDWGMCEAEGMAALSLRRFCAQSIGCDLCPLSGEDHVVCDAEGLSTPEYWKLSREEPSYDE